MTPTLSDVRAAALDRALVGDDPKPALALVGVVDSVVRRTTDSVVRRPADSVMRRPTDDHSAAQRATTDRPRDDGTGRETFAVAMLAVGCLATEYGSRIDDRAWEPGADGETDPRVVAGAAVAVRARNLSLDRAATLADCAPATLEAAVERQQRREKR